MFTKEELGLIQALTKIAWTTGNVKSPEVGVELVKLSAKVRALENGAQVPAALDSMPPPVPTA